MALLNEAEKQKVSEAVARAESRTAGELVVVLARRADAHVAPRLWIAGLATVALALEVFWRFPFVPPWLVFLGQIPVAFGLHLLLGLGPLLRLVTSKAQLAAAVDSCAKRAFLEMGVMETRDRSGVLILLSELEHHVEILADRGIHERVDPGEWEEDVQRLLRAIRERRPAEGLIEVIERIGAILAEKFPQRPDDTNELDDRVREIG